MEPGRRFIGIPSETLGEDWFQRSQMIDEALSRFGMELAEESVYLEFDRAPGAILHGEGNCLVMRPVTGPKRTPDAPFFLKDTQRHNTYTHQLKARDFTAVFQEAYEAWEKLQREGKKVGSGFTVCIRRQLRGELQLAAQLIFPE